jgi:hypothetical protein
MMCSLDAAQRNPGTLERRRTIPESAAFFPGQHKLRNDEFVDAYDEPMRWMRRAAAG